MRWANKKGKTVRILSLLIFAGIVFVVILFSSHNLSLGAPSVGGANCTGYSVTMSATPSTGTAGSTFSISADGSAWIGCVCGTQSVTSTAWTLNFGDGSSQWTSGGGYAEQISQNHIYASNGTYYPSSTLTVSCGTVSNANNVASTTVKVTPAYPSINATAPSGPLNISIGDSATYGSTFTWTITNATVGLSQYSVDASGNPKLVKSYSTKTTNPSVAESYTFSFNNASATSYIICAEGTSQ